jgi:hypothetical protein
MDCFAERTPGGTCGNFAWIDHRRGSLGQPNSIVEWHSADGECYLESSVPAYPMARSIQLGPGHANRCSRDLVYRNPESGRVTRVPNFLPRKDGTGGSRLTLSQSSTTSCIANCGLIPPPPVTQAAPAPEPSSIGSQPSVQPANNPQPPSPPAPKPPMPIVKPAPSGNGTQTFQTSAAPMMPSVNTGKN